MHLDVVDLRNFYYRTQLGRVAQRAIRDKVKAEAEYVGPRFADEARRIHFEEAPNRGIYGEATREEVTSLAEDGIDVTPLPPLPEDLS